MKRKTERRKMEKQQYITSSVYTFADMREYNYLYVDKTEYLWKLVSHPKSMFFFSRPRRFGKSLTLSTLKAIFQGKKELFKGLYIENQPYVWKPYPVIHLDMGSVSADTPDKLEKQMTELLKRQAKINKIELDDKNEIGANSLFINLVNNLYDRDGKVVILIDEYDKPILNNIQNENLEKLQDVMKGFYSVLKTCEPYERFVFITGVGKFFKVSIFSDLNNLTDISMSDDYATLCGYTEKELKENFKTQLLEASKRYDEDYATFLKDIKGWYDGYKFSENGESVYNPVSTAKFFEDYGKFKNYWFETGSPSILVKLIKQDSINLQEILDSEYTEEIFTDFAPSNISFIALMYQTGYLTIKDCYYEKNMDGFTETHYKLGFPNFEVEQSFHKFFISNTGNNVNLGNNIPNLMKQAMKQNNVDKMMETVNSYLSTIPNKMQIRNEKYYQTVFYSLFKIIGYYIRAEEQTSDGRIDAYIENGNNVFIFEFKLDKSSDEAFDQIMKKEYYLKFQNSGKKITLVGANFDFETRRLKDYKKKEL